MVRHSVCKAVTFTLLDLAGRTLRDRHPFLKVLVAWDETSVRVSVSAEEAETLASRRRQLSQNKPDRISRRKKIDSVAPAAVAEALPVAVADGAVDAPVPAPAGAAGGAADVAAGAPLGGADAAALPAVPAPPLGGPERPRRKRARSSIGQKSRTTTIQHSCVMSFSMGACPVAKVHDSSSWSGRTLFAPPCEVASTNHICVGKAVLRGLERFILNTQVREWIRSICPKFKLWCWLLVMDFASGNRSFVRKLVPLLSHNLDLTCLVCVWLEVCKLHKLGRIMKKVSRRHRLDSALYSVSRILQHKHSFGLRGVYY